MTFDDIRNALSMINIYRQDRIIVLVDDNVSILGRSVYDEVYSDLGTISGNTLPITFNDIDGQSFLCNSLDDLIAAVQQEIEDVDFNPYDD